MDGCVGDKGNGRKRIGVQMGREVAAVEAG